MKNTIIISLSLLILASCTKEQTLGDKLDGVWQVSSVSATGTVDILGSTVPVVAADSYSNSDSSQF